MIPVEATSTSTSGNHKHSPKTARREDSLEFALQGLQLLFHSEYLALVEYIECIIPLVFVTYKTVLEQLPNVIYYPGGPGNWGPGVVANILVLAALEVCTFIFLDGFVRRKFAVSPLYQLAFVLETQIYSVQALLVLESVTLLQYELFHLGKPSFIFIWTRVLS